MQKTFTPPSLLVALLLALGAYAPVRAQSCPAVPAKSEAVVVFNHCLCQRGSEAACVVRQKIRLERDELFTVHIANTYPDLFDYTPEAFKRSEFISNARAPQPDFQSYYLTQIYDPQYAGYVIRIKPKADNTYGLLEAVITIQVDEEKGWLDAWDATIDGGFVVSGLRDRNFGLVDSTFMETEEVTEMVTDDQGNITEQTMMREVEKTVQLIKRFEKKESDWRIGVASLIHARHERFPYIGPTVGLGFQSDKKTTVFFGVHTALGPISLSAGRVVGPRTRLPDGVSLGSVAKDVNVLNNLDTQTAGGWYFAFSLQALGGDAENNLKKAYGELGFQGFSDGGTTDIDSDSGGGLASVSWKNDPDLAVLGAAMTYAFTLEATDVEEAVTVNLATTGGALALQGGSPADPLPVTFDQGTKEVLIDLTTSETPGGYEIRSTVATESEGKVTPRGAQPFQVVPSIQWTGEGTATKPDKIGEAVINQLYTFNLKGIGLTDNQSVKIKVENGGELSHAGTNDTEITVTVPQDGSVDIGFKADSASTVTLSIEPVPNLVVESPVTINVK